jgi:hypothetical protein
MRSNVFIFVDQEREGMAGIDVGADDILELFAKLGVIRQRESWGGVSRVGGLRG